MAALDMSAEEKAAKRGEVDTLYIGRLRKAISASLRKQLKPVAMRHCRERHAATLYG
jgi:hypothetical protein